MKTLALTVLAIVGHELRELNLGTAVVPIQTRHPTMLAAQARTVQDAIGARLSLGVGLSHQMVVEGMWGISFERPASYMHEYLNALAPMLCGDAVNVQGGGPNGQAGAVRHGIARALTASDVNLRPALKAEGLLTRDPRKRERKKYGQPGARKRFQFSKR